MATRSLRPLGALFILAAIALAALSGPTGARSPAGDWAVLVEDPAGDTQGPADDERADLVRVSAREEGDRLWLRLETRPAAAPTTAPSPSLPVALPTTAATSSPAAPPADVTSRLSFTLARADKDTSATFDLVADAGGFRLVRDGSHEVSNALVMPDDATPWAYEIGLTRWALFSDNTFAPGDRIHRVSADIQTHEAPARTDRAPDAGFAGEFVHTLGPDGQVVPTWTETEGVDFGAGPDVAADGDGNIHVSYIVYATERGTDKGLYHATVTHEGWSAERVADARLPGELHQDAKTMTAIAADDAGGVHIAYHPEAGVGTVGKIRYAHSDGSTWTVEDPAALSSATQLNVENGHRAVPDIIAESGRVVVAFQRGDADTLSIVERSDAGVWDLVRTFTAARFARLDIDGDGKLHVAWFKPLTDGYPDRGVDGALMYSTEKDGWAEHTIAAGGLTDITRFWEGAEGDGSFDFELGPGDVPTFLYDDGRQQYLATLEDGGVTADPAPLKPVHGNPQYRIRMGFDGDGNLHAISGYGGSDHYAFRSADGFWTLQDNYRHDMFSLAVTPDGRAATAYTQPHGGTTVAVSLQGSAPRPASKDDDGPYTPVFLPGPGGVAALAVLGAFGLVGARWGLPAMADRRPRWIWRGLALAGAGFSRLTRDELLDHETRDILVAAAREAPGRPAAELRRDLELPRSTFFYHLRRLENDGLLRLARQGTQIFVYSAGAGPAIASPSTFDAQLVDVVAQAPGLAASDYALRLQRHPRLVHQRLLRLSRQGRIAAVRLSARDVRWQPTPSAAA